MKSHLNRILLAVVLIAAALEMLGHRVRTKAIVLPEEVRSLATVTPERSPAVKVLPVPPPSPPAEKDGKLDLLKEILATKNDNDPRLDSEFRKLTPELKTQLREYYGSLPREAFNSRGTVVFLLSRNIESKEDADFLISVLKEPPCLSYLDCRKELSDSDADPDMVSSLTLAYPQVVMLRSVGKIWALPMEPDRREELKQAIKEAALSENSFLAQTAEEARATVLK